MHKCDLFSRVNIRISDLAGLVYFLVGPKNVIPSQIVVEV